jgi:hypothetical protein
MTKKYDSLFERVRDRFAACVDYESYARNNYDIDTKFANGDSINNYQWPQAIRDSRNGVSGVGPSKPCLTINKTKVHNLSIINDAKQNKPGVNIRPIGDGATYEAAQVYMDIVRHIEYRSNAESIYDGATVTQVEGGIGYWRVMTAYESNKSFDQEILLTPIGDPRSVYLDPDIRNADGSDARFGFIYDDMPKDLFKEKFPKADEDTYGPALPGDYTGDWITKNHVRVCEYFEKSQKKDKLVSFVDPNGERVTATYSDLTDEGKEYFKTVRDSEDTNVRDIITDNVMWYKIAGCEVVEEKEWPGIYIPIIRVVGTETILDGRMDRFGNTRALLDPQRMYNYNAALAIDTKIPTPDGWTTMGEIKKGDKIFDQDGNIVNVADALPIKIGETCYNVVFDNGQVITTDAGHIWRVEEKGKRKSATFDYVNKTVSTEELISDKHFIYMNGSLNTKDANLLIDPYLLGLWLGDGSTNAPVISSHVSDVEEEKSLLADLGYTCGKNYNVPGNGTAYTVNDLRWRLIELGLFGNKFLPQNYLRASYHQRLSLLQGLMDSDGHYAKTVNQCIFVNSDKTIIDGFVELCATLSIKTTIKIQPEHSIYNKNGLDYIAKKTYRVQFTVSPLVSVFRLERKATEQTCHRNTQNRRTKRVKVVAVVPVESVPVRCITLDTAEHLYLCGETMIPTHNSNYTEMVALQPRAPFVGPLAAIEGLEEYWKTANTRDHSMLPYNHMAEDGTPIPPPQRSQPPALATAYISGMDMSEKQMMMASGQYQSQMGENENAKSGIAINARQRQGERATYHFIDNLGIAIRFTGKILIDLIPKIYDTQRVVRIRGLDGKVSDVIIDPNAPDALQKQQNAQQELDRGLAVSKVIFNPNVGTYDVQADVGPGYATRRQEAWNAFTQIASQNPKIMDIAGDLMFKVADFPMADELSQRFAKVIPPNITGDAPNPQLEQAMHMASDKIEQLTAELAKEIKKNIDKDKELDIKAYSAESERLRDIGNAGPIMDKEELRPIIQQMLREMMKDPKPLDGDDVPTNIGNQPMQQQPAQAPLQRDDMMLNDDDMNEEAPMEGAKKAPDGNWYVPDESRPGKFQQVEAT